jgi:hypothetical protein
MIEEKKRKPWWDKEIQRMNVIINNMNDAINAVIDRPSSEAAEELQVSFNAMDISNKYTFEEKGTLRKKLAEYERDIEGGHDMNIYDIYAPLIHIGKMPFVWIGNRPKTLYFVANREVLYVPEEYYQHRIIIGATESEMYIKDACGKDYEKMSEIIEINKFKYSKNFVLMRLMSDKKKTETRMMYTLMNLLNQQNAEHEKSGEPTVPYLVLESSKMKQESLQKHMKSRCIISTNDSEMDQFFNWETGKANIFYSNSTLSRGLDVPFYDVIFADSLNFSVPYWTAMREYYKREGDTNMVFECNAIITKIISDEVTNSVLRCSPTKDTEIDPINEPGVMSTKENDVKIIVIRESDVSKILPNVRAQMRDHEIAFRSDDKSEVMNAKLKYNVQHVRDLAKKVSRHSNLKNRVISAESQLRIYCEHLLRTYSKKLQAESTLKGLSVQELDAYMEKEQCCASNFETLQLVDPEIRDRILQEHNLTKKWRMSKDALIGRILPKKKSASARNFGSPKITRAKIIFALDNMTKAGLLRGEFDGKTWFYRLPDKTLYGEPPE